MGEGVRCTGCAGAAVSRGCDGDVVLLSTHQATEGAVGVGGAACEHNTLAAAHIHCVCDAERPLKGPGDQRHLSIAVQRGRDGRRRTWGCDAEKHRISGHHLS